MKCVLYTITCNNFINDIVEYLNKEVCRYGYYCNNINCTRLHNFNNYKCIYNLWIYKWKNYICQITKYSESNCNNNRTLKRILYDTNYTFNYELWNPNF